MSEQLDKLRAAIAAAEARARGVDRLVRSLGRAVELPEAWRQAEAADADREDERQHEARLAQHSKHSRAEQSRAEQSKHSTAQHSMA